MTVAVEGSEVLVDPDSGAIEFERVKVTPKEQNMQEFAALLAQAYVAMPLFA